MSNKTTEISAKNCIKTWIELYKETDVNKLNKSAFLSIIDENFVETQTHGLRLNGIDQVVKYYQLWCRAKPVIEKIEMTEFHYQSENEIAFFKWNFIFLFSSNKIDCPNACGIIYYKNNKMLSLNEYEMSGPICDWDGTAEGTGLTA